MCLSYYTITHLDYQLLRAKLCLIHVHIHGPSTIFSTKIILYTLKLPKNKIGCLKRKLLAPYDGKIDLDKLSKDPQSAESGSPRSGLSSSEHP